MTFIKVSEADPVQPPESEQTPAAEQSTLPSSTSHTAASPIDTPSRLPPIRGDQLPTLNAAPTPSTTPVAAGAGNPPIKQEFPSAKANATNAATTPNPDHQLNQDQLLTRLQELELQLEKSKKELEKFRNNQPKPNEPQQETKTPSGNTPQGQQPETDYIKLLRIEGVKGMASAFDAYKKFHGQPPSERTVARWIRESPSLWNSQNAPARAEARRLLAAPK